MASKTFGTFDLALAIIAVVVIVGSSALLQRAGLTQPWAMAAAVPAGLLVVYPTIRRWSRGHVPVSQWAFTIAGMTIISLLLHILLLRI